MKKAIFLIFVLSITFSCNKENLSENDIMEEEGQLTLQERAPDIPNPVIIGEQNSGCVANIIFLAEGFTGEQMSEFEELCIIAKQAILDMEPFSTAADDLNFYRVNSRSEGTHIGTIQFESVCNGTTGEDEETHTPWSVFTNRVGIYYYAGMGSNARNNLEDLYGSYATGDYAYTIIIANTTEYFGGAEFPGVTQYNTIENPRVSNMIVSKAGDTDTFKFLIRHEFGHSFGNLDDEYVDELTDCAIKTYEEWYLPDTPKPNVLTYNPGGWFQGARYRAQGYWRQWDHSIMSDDYDAVTFSPRQGSIVKKRLAIATNCN